MKYKHLLLPAALWVGTLLSIAAILAIMGGCAQQPVGPIHVDKSVTITVPIEKLDANRHAQIHITTRTDTTNTSDTQTRGDVDNKPTTDVSPEIDVTP